MDFEAGFEYRAVTQNPEEQASVVRMASIPHGTSVNAQGLAETVHHRPHIDPVSITPFVIGQPAKLVPSPESDLSVPTKFRFPQPPQLSEISQEMVNDPNSVLAAAIAGQHITKTVVLEISTSPAAPLVGSGTGNIAFLQGTATGPNADSALMKAIFWIETVAEPHKPPFLQLQYTQTVLLNFNGLSWPHVSVATLRKV